jgi:tetratricopeptide (TPR) repeat protein
VTSKIGDQNEAIAAYQTALEICTRLVADNPGNYEARLASIHKQLGVLLDYNGKTDEGIEHLKLALKTWTGLQNGNPDDLGYRGEAADTCRWLAWVHKRIGKPDEARPWYKRGIEAFEKVIAESPDSPQFRRGLAGCLMGISGVQKPDEAVASLKTAEEILLINKGLAESQELATVYRRLAIRQNEVGQRNEAMRTCKKALALSEQLAAENPDVLHLRGAIANACSKLASLHAYAGQYEAAKSLYERAIEVNEAIVAAHPTRVQVTVGLGIDRGNLAWLLATPPNPVLRDAERAVELAKKAVSLQSQRHGQCHLRMQGIAEYRSGDFEAARDSLTKSLTGSPSCEGHYPGFRFFLAMTHQQLGERQEALTWHSKAVEWMEKYDPEDDLEEEKLRQFRAEAAELLGIEDEATEHNTTESESPNKDITESDERNADTQTPEETEKERHDPR